MRIFLFAVAALAMSLSFAPSASRAAVETIVEVNATQTVHFANRTLAEIQATVPGGAVMPPNAPSSSNYWGDAYQANTIPAYVDLTGMGPVLNISAIGSWKATNAASATGPEGNGVVVLTQGVYAELGVSQLQASLNTLVGVFTTDTSPTVGSVTPATLSTLLSSDMTTPELNQAFAIGALLNGIQIPEGATGLWLGIHNGYDWSGGTGSVTVTVEGVPEPASLAVWSILGAVGMAYGYRRRKAGEPAAV